MSRIFFPSNRSEGAEFYRWYLFYAFIRLDLVRWHGDLRTSANWDFYILKINEFDLICLLSVVFVYQRAHGIYCKVWYFSICKLCTRSYCNIEISALVVFNKVELFVINILLHSRLILLHLKNIPLHSNQITIKNCIGPPSAHIRR